MVLIQIHNIIGMKVTIETMAMVEVFIIFPKNKEKIKTPLIDAVKNENEPLLKYYLIERGADPKQNFL